MKKNSILVFIAAVVFLFVVVGGGAAWHFSQQSSQPATAVVVAGIEEDTVEIFHLPHGPAEDIVQKVEVILEEHSSYTVTTYSFDDTVNEEKIAEYGVTGHIPIAIFIGGNNSFVIDGRDVILENFPQGDAFVPSLEGSWSYEDLSIILSDPAEYSNAQ